MREMRGNILKIYDARMKKPRRQSPEGVRREDLRDDHRDLSDVSTYISDTD
jgi:hypothetical protein